MIPDERVVEVVSRLTGVPTVELMLGTPTKLPLFCSAGFARHDRVDLGTGGGVRQGDDQVGDPLYRGAH